MKDIKTIIKEKQSEVARLRRTVEDLQKAESELRVLKGAYRIMGGEPENPVDNSEHLHFADNVTRNVPTNAEAAEIILKDFGKALHIKSIYDEIKTRYSKDTTLDSVNVTIIRKIKKGETFYKSAAATYGLTSWHKTQNDKGIVVDSVKRGN